jgi:aryl carrier-like protein
VDPRNVTPISGTSSNRLLRLEELARAYRQGAEIDWKEVYPAGGRVVSLPQYPFQKRLYWWPEAAPSNQAAIPSGAEREGMVERLRVLSPPDRFDRLLTFICQETRALFGMDESEPLDENRGLVEMGMNSLMAVMLEHELEVALGVQLSATVMLDHPNLSAIARFLDGKLFPDQSAPPQPVMACTTEALDVQRDAIDIAAMSDEEVDAAFENELAALRKLGVS